MDSPQATDNRPLFVTFEGIEGSGKTLLINMLYDALSTDGYQKLVLTRQPGGSQRLGETLRGLFLRDDLYHKASLMLLMADRAQHVYEVIRDADKDAVILCDRYVDSSVAYQYYMEGHPRALINAMNLYVTEGIMPHLTILLDVDPKVGFQRICKVKGRDVNKYDEISEQSMQKARWGFQFLAEDNPSRFMVLDATQPAENLHARIYTRVKSMIEERRNSR